MKGMTNKIVFAAALACQLWTAALPAQRQQVSIEPLTSLQHQPTKDFSALDPVTGRVTRFPFEGRIEYQPLTGDFRLSWNGADGRRRTVDYEPRDKVRAELIASVTFDEKTQLFTYDYTIINSRNSRQAIRHIYIEGGSTDKIESPSRDWMTSEFQDVSKRRFQSEGGWSWSLLTEAGVSPGDSASGFRLVSRFPPTTVRVFLAGANRTMGGSEEMPEELEIAVANANWRLPRGITVGPSRSATASTPVAAAISLAGSVEQASVQGWFGTSARSGQIRNAVARLPELVSRQDFASARAVIAELRGMSAVDAGLLSEARALLTHGLRQLETMLGR